MKAEMIPSRMIRRRSFLQAGTIGALGLSMTGVAAARLATAGPPTARPRAVIFLFLTGGPSQHDTFDMKPQGPVDFKGEFNPIATRTPGIKICEHLPRLAQRSPHWALVRSLTHKNSGHQEGTYVMLTGRTQLPSSFRASRPQGSDWPSIAAVAGAMTQRRGIWPGSAVLPEKIVHSNQGVFPGQFAGLLGNRHEPWFIDATDKPHAYHSYSGAFPKYLFNLHKGQLSDKDDWRFEVANLALPEGVLGSRQRQRMSLLGLVERQQRQLEETAAVAKYDRLRQSAVSLLTSPQVRHAFDVRKADPRTLARYGNNSFGWSLLMARRLVEAGVNLVQVNLGNFGSWDLHGNNFHCLKQYLFPPTDRAVSALLDDLHESGLLDSTLVVMAGEFGRTPRITHIAPEIYKYPGRDHWAPLQSVLFAGGSVRGGTVIGSSDANGAYPASDPQTPEHFAATIYHALGIPRDAEWHDATGRPHPVYLAAPIQGLMG
ncbi:MAG: DUF1501 domain-containing protein [Planctomycetes bacterium]|nr:DUF1501 domain-containing protein [Planctomycetota bacterium]